MDEHAKQLGLIIELLQDNQGDVKEIKAVTADLVEANTINTHKLDEVLEKVDEHERILRGENGDPGLLEEFHSAVKLVSSNASKINGDPDHEGIEKKVDKLHAFYVGSGRIVYLVFGAAVPIVLKLLADLAAHVQNTP